MTEGNFTIRRYHFWAPYFKQGDDLSNHLERQDTAERAFREHSEQMELAALLLRKMADVVAAVPEAEVFADGHFIGIVGPADKLDPYTEGEDAILEVDEPEDEDFEGVDLDEEHEADWEDEEGYGGDA